MHIRLKLILPSLQNENNDKIVHTRALKVVNTYINSLFKMRFELENHNLQRCLAQSEGLLLELDGKLLNSILLKFFFQFKNSLVYVVYIIRFHKRNSLPYDNCVFFD